MPSTIVAKGAGAGDHALDHHRAAKLLGPGGEIKRVQPEGVDPVLFGFGDDVNGMRCGVNHWSAGDADLGHNLQDQVLHLAARHGCHSRGWIDE